jgi:putative membrane protein
MRAICLLFLLVFAAVVVVLAVQNQHDVTLRFFDWSFTPPMALVLAVAYLLGMLTGGSIIGMIRRSLHRATEDPRYAAAR